MFYMYKNTWRISEIENGWSHVESTLIIFIWKNATVPVLRVKGFGLLVVMNHCPVPPLPTDSDCHCLSVRVSCPVGRVGALMYALFPGKGCISVPCH